MEKELSNKANYTLANKVTGRLNRAGRLPRQQILILLLCSFLSLGYTPQEAEQIYRDNNCEMVSQTEDSQCFNCTPLQLPDGECVSPIGIDVTVHWKPEWELPPVIEPEPEPEPEPPTDFAGAIQGEDGKASFLANAFDTNTSDSLVHSWVEENGYMVASPDSGVRHDFADGLQVHLTYKIRFVKTGMHYIWIEGLYEGNASSDSVHYGFEGQRSGDMTFLNKTWSNQRQSAEGRAEFAVTSEGDYQFDIWMREDGTKIRTIEIVTDAGYIPQ
jgi:hypothetical protein